MPRKSEQEWAIIETDYIKNPVTYDILSEKYHISTRALTTRAVLNDWNNCKDRFSKFSTYLLN